MYTRTHIPGHIHPTTTARLLLQEHLRRGRLSQPSYPSPSLLRSGPRMDRREGRKRARDEGEASAAAAGKRTKAGAVQMAFEEAALALAEGWEAWQRPPGVFEFPWLKCRGGLGVPCGGGSLELRDVFFRSLVDGRAAAIGMPGDRLFPPPSKRALFDDLDAWLATAGDGEVDPFWRSVLEGPRPAA